MAKLDKNTMSTFEATMRACQESKQTKDTTKKTLKESVVLEKDDIDAGIDDYEFFDDEVVDFDGEPINETGDDDIAEGTFDDVAVIIDPELDPEDVSSNIDELQQLIDDTPEGETPTSDEYVGDYTYTCPICGNKFFNDTELADGSECPVCGETPEAFILMGEVSKIDEEDTKEKESTEEEVEETKEEVETAEDIEESKKVDEGCSKDDDEDDKAEKKEESKEKLELDSKPVWTPPKRSNKRPKKAVTKDNALKLERARRRARAMQRARRMEARRNISRRGRRVEGRKPSRRTPVRPRRRVNVAEARRRRARMARRMSENRTRINRRPSDISRRRRVESRRRVRPTRPTRRVENRQLRNRHTMPRRRRVESLNTKNIQLNEKSFNRLLTKFVTENFKNITSMEVKKAKLSKNKTMTLECVLTKKDKSTVNTQLVIENFRIRRGLNRYSCEVDKAFSPKAESKTRNRFFLECRVNRDSMDCTKFRYNYVTENKAGTYKVFGLCE